MEFPMFPLGSVLFPGQLLPLHIFEPRYQEMLRHCLAGSEEFGVVLIERGHEVGGGDVRSRVGTVAKILQSVEIQAGHWAVVCAGTRRIQVERWGSDDPWPRAEVTDLPDLESPMSADVEARWSALCRQFRRVAALAAELGDQPVPVGAKLDDDPAIASFQIAALSPLGSFDRQKVLATVGLEARVRLLGSLLNEVQEAMEASLEWDGQADQGT